MMKRAVLMVFLLMSTSCGGDDDEAVLDQLADAEGPLYVHCAAGHGRSAMLAATLLVRRGHAEDVDAAVALMQRARPGVRLLAVEFYATWCKPCMEAVPRWTRLHEQYREDGLRLVVVNTLDPQGGCSSPGWNPDDMVCDLEGFHQERMKVGGDLPSALLWSWQGNLLVKHGHVDEVEQAVKTYLATSPRVHVEASHYGGKAHPELEAMVVEELTALKKLTVVADAKEQERLRQLRKDSHGLAKREDQKCEIGQEVSANSLLTATLLGKKKGKRKLALALYSVESGCQLASHYVGYSEKSPKLSVREAVAGLHDKMRRDLVMPTQERKNVAAIPKDTRSQTEIEMDEMSRGMANKPNTQPTKPLVAEHNNSSEIWAWALT